MKKQAVCGCRRARGNISSGQLLSAMHPLSAPWRMKYRPPAAAISHGSHTLALSHPYTHSLNQIWINSCRSFCGSCSSPTPPRMPFETPGHPLPALALVRLLFQLPLRLLRLLRPSAVVHRVRLTKAASRPSPVSSKHRCRFRPITSSKSQSAI